MKPWILSLLFSFFFSSLAIADPFYADEDQAQTTPNSPTAVAKKSPNLTPCKPTENINNIYLPLDFKELKLVGIVQFEQDFRALFSDKDNQLFDLKTDDYVVSAGIQIKHIDFKTVTLIDWQQTELCQNPHIIQLKL